MDKYPTCPIADEERANYILMFLSDKVDGLINVRLEIEKSETPRLFR